MKTLTAAVLALALAAPVAADEHEAPPPWQDLPLIVQLALILPASMTLLGEFWEGVCVVSGNEFLEADEPVGPGGHWYCTGFPRPQDGATS